MSLVRWSTCAAVREPHRTRSLSQPLPAKPYVSAHPGNQATALLTQQQVTGTVSDVKVPSWNTRHAVPVQSTSVIATCQCNGLDLRKHTPPLKFATHEVVLSLKDLLLDRQREDKDK